jgi:hypothetical protein
MTHRGSLTTFAPLMRDPDPDGAHKLAARKWHEDGDLVLFAGDIAGMDWQDRELLNAIGTRRYGARQGQKNDG